MQVSCSKFITQFLRRYHRTKGFHVVTTRLIPDCRWLIRGAYKVCRVAEQLPHNILGDTGGLFQSASWAARTRLGHALVPCQAQGPEAPVPHLRDRITALLEGALDHSDGPHVRGDKNAAGMALVLFVHAFPEGIPVGRILHADHLHRRPRLPVTIVSE